MAINPIQTVSLQREDPPESGGNWTTADLAILARNIPLLIRGMFTTQDIGGLEQPAVMFFERRRPTDASWQVMRRLGVTLKDTWYNLSTNWGGFAPGEWEIRVRCVHSTGTYYSNVISILQLSLALWPEESPPPGTGEEVSPPTTTADECDAPNPTGTEIEADASSSWTEREKPSGTATELIPPATGFAQEEAPGGTATEEALAIVSSFTERDQAGSTWTEEESPTDTAGEVQRLVGIMTEEEVQP